MPPTTNGAPATWSRVGWWREGGALDRWDKAVSSPVFRLELPRALEWAVAVPFLLHGAVALSLGFLPTVLCACVDRDPLYVGAVAVPAGCAAAAALVAVFRGRLPFKHLPVVYHSALQFVAFRARHP